MLYLSPFIDPNVLISMWFIFGLEDFLSAFDADTYLGISFTIVLQLFSWFIYLWCYIFNCVPNFGLHQLTVYLFRLILFSNNIV